MSPDMGEEKIYNPSMIIKMIVYTIFKNNYFIRCILY